LLQPTNTMILKSSFVFVLCSSAVVAFEPGLSLQRRSVVGTNHVMGSNSRVKVAPLRMSDSQVNKVDELLKKVDFAKGLDSAKEFSNSLTKIDTSLDFESIRRNILDGDIGERGEEYALVQFFLIACVLIGGIPLVGDFAMLLFGPGAFLGGLAVLVLGVTQLGGNLSPWPIPAPGGTLVTSGIYEKVRHPIYAGLLATLIGISIISGSATRLVLTGLFFYAVNTKVDQEEEMLTDKFGYQYEQYQKDVPGKYFPQEILNELPWSKQGDDV